MNRIQRLEYLEELSAAPGSKEATLRPVKDLTFAHTGGYTDAFFEYVKEGRTQLRLDLTGVTFIDSGGVGALVKLRRSLEGSGGHLTLLNAGRTVTNILKLVGLAALVKQEAVAPVAPREVPPPASPTEPTHLEECVLGDEQPAAAAAFGASEARVVVGENVTHLNADGLLDALLARLGQGIKEVRVDVAQVDFIDSAGVGALLKAAKAFAGAGGELILVSPTAMLQRILKIVKLDRVLKIES